MPAIFTARLATVDKEQDVVCDKSLDRADLDSEEISCRQAFPMSSEKRRPRGVLVSLRGGSIPFL